MNRINDIPKEDDSKDRTTITDDVADTVTEIEGGRELRRRVAEHKKKIAASIAQRRPIIMKPIELRTLTPKESRP